MLDCLDAVKRPRKIFIHINNTNPMLNAESPEHRAVLRRGMGNRGGRMAIRGLEPSLHSETLLSAAAN